MKVRCSRISALLKPEGFVVRQSAGLAESCGYVREDCKLPLFQMIDASFAGRRKEAALAHITLSATKWVRIKGLSISQLLDEIAWDKDRGWSVITTEDEAKSWEGSLAQFGPIRVGELASKVGTALLEQTHAARTNAQNLLAHFDQHIKVCDHIKQFEQTVPSEKVAEAQRLAQWPGVMQSRGSEQTYFLACLAILNSVDTALSMGQNPLNNDQLMWQIQLVADGLMSMDFAQHNSDHP